VPDRGEVPVVDGDLVTVNEGLPVGTRVQKGAGCYVRAGTVMPHEPEYSRGGFPVRFDDGIWEMLDASYVTVLAPPEE
jgi:hypothetical protein